MPTFGTNRLTMDKISINDPKVKFKTSFMKLYILRHMASFHFQEIKKQ